MASLLRVGPVRALVVARAGLRAASTTVAPSAAAAGSAVPLLPVKHKSHFKRASEVMSAVNRDAVARMAAKMALFRPPMPHFNVGDAVEITYAQEIGESDPLPIRGTVMGKWRNGIDTKFAIINSMDNEWYTATYTTSSPLLRGVRVLQRNRVTEGRRRVRRGKLTNLLLEDADPHSFLVDASTKDAAAIAAEAKQKELDKKKGKKAAAAAGGKDAAPAAGKGKAAAGAEKGKAAAAGGKGGKK